MKHSLRMFGLVLTCLSSTFAVRNHAHAEIVTSSTGFTVNEFAWYDDEHLIYAQPKYDEKVQRLFVWQNSSSRPILDIPLNAFWCAGNGRLLAATGFSDHDRSSVMLVNFLSGPLDQLYSSTIHVAYTAKNQKDFDIDHTLLSRLEKAGLFVDAFECEFNPWPMRADQSPTALFMLKPDDGAVRVNLPVNTRDVGTYYYYSAPDRSGVRLNIPGPDVECFFYDPRRAQYLLTPCSPGSAQAEYLQRENCIRAWWLTPGQGAIEQVCVSNPIDDRDSFSRVAPWRDGYLWLNEEHGIYKLGNKTEHILDAPMSLNIFDSWAISPSGCRLAAQTRQETENMPIHTIHVLELC